MRIDNRQARHNYEILEKFDAGIDLLGPEVKSVREGQVSLNEAFVHLRDGQAYLINAHIHPYQNSQETINPTRSRKLLLHKKEIEKIQIKLKTGGRLTLVPISCYTKGRHIKLSLAMAKGRGEIAKKKLERAEDVKRNQKQEMKEYLNRG